MTTASKVNGQVYSATVPLPKHVRFYVLDFAVQNPLHSRIGTPRQIKGHRGHRRHANRGFTLIEVVIVMAILAILTTLGVPMYNDQMTKGRRGGALAFLLEVSAKQQQFYADQRQFTDDLRSLGYAAASPTTDGGYYQVSAVLGAGNQSYTLTATRKLAQVNDSECGDLTLSSFGARSAINASAARPDQTCW